MTKSTPTTQLQKPWLDLLIAICFAIVFSCLVFKTAQLLPPVILTDTEHIDIWFQSDVPKVYEVMTDKSSPRHSRCNTHPLFSLLTYPVAFVAEKVFHMDPLLSTQAVMALVAFAWIFLLYVFLRFIGCRRWDASLFSTLAAISAASVFWHTAPETFSFGSTSIILALLIGAAGERYILAPYWYLIANIATLSFTTTNWLAGICVTIVNNSIQKSLRIITYSFAAVTVLWAVEKFIFTDAEFFLYIARNSRFILQAESGGPFHSVLSFFYHTLIMPSIHLAQKSYSPEWPMMLTQLSFPGSGTPWGGYAAVLWTVLVVIGIWSILTLQAQPRLRAALGLTILGQLALHSIYGSETFLYSLHFIVLLVPLVALASLTKARPTVLVLTALLIPCVAVNNFIQFNKAFDVIKAYGTSRDQVNVQMHLRPHDPWPRGKGHVILAYPGTEELAKGYHEPGGSFSPIANSFGVSIWVMDNRGQLLTTSDTIPAKNISQTFLISDQRPIPAISTETEYYHAVWSTVEPGRWRLDLKQKQQDIRLMAVVRGVGPAAGPVKTLKWDDRLTINDRWTLGVNPIPDVVNLGIETENDWIKTSTVVTEVTGHNGWGYAKIHLSKGDIWSLTINDPLFKINSSLKYSNTRSTLQVSLPEAQFADSLNAQTVHLMMSLVDLQTRPGDPLEYPQAWQREAAYIAVALARAGQLNAAEQLSRDIAETDFFGGFGPEADAPGLAIWALTEIADLIDRPDYDEFIWPHIRRKAEFIEKMKSETKPIYGTFTGITIPKFNEDGFISVSMIANKAKNGLIQGKMHLHIPIFYVNAVSYLGLKNAAIIAKRMKESDLSLKWNNEADQIQQAWGQEYRTSDENPSNPRTYSSALWPSRIAQPYSDVFLRNLEQRWTSTRDANDAFKFGLSSPNFAVAEAHQWLLLGDTNRLWRTLNWFWNHQTSPGLYTWGEGNMEKNSTFNHWENIRGWVNPQHVTPHYWTAAEMLLLQINMLAYLDPTQKEATIVIGGGIPKQWLKDRMEVKGLLFPKRTINWKWDGRQMQVEIKGEPVKILLGSAFPQNTVISVENIY